MVSLAHSNKHLSTPAKREKAVRLTVSTSSAIDGIRAPFKRGKPAVKVAGKSVNMGPESIGDSNRN